MEPQLNAALIIFPFLIVVSAVFTAFISALSSLSQDDEDSLPKKIEEIHDRPDKVIAAGLCLYIPLAIAFWLLFISGMSSYELYKLIIAGIAALLLQISAGILFPLSIGRHHRVNVCERLCGICSLISLILSPLTYITNGISYLMGIPFGIGKEPTDDNVTEDEILAIVNEGQESGTIEENEAKMINNIFELSNTEASEIQTPRGKIAAFSDEIKLKDALKDILNSTYSRYPVYHEDIDHIIGILHIKDAVRLLEQSPKKNPRLSEIKDDLLVPEFVPETKNIDDLFREMQAANAQMVIVTDEYGQTSGIIAMEDILEEIVGSIRDEYDKEQDQIKSEDGVYEIDGFTRLEDLAEQFDIDFGETELETINGYMTDRMGHIPEENEKYEVEVGGYLFSILSVEDKIIKLVKVTSGDLNK